MKVVKALLLTSVFLFSLGAYAQDDYNPAIVVMHLCNRTEQQLNFNPPASLLPPTPQVSATPSFDLPTNQCIDIQLKSNADTPGSIIVAGFKYSQAGTGGTAGCTFTVSCMQIGAYKDHYYCIQEGLSATSTLRGDTAWARSVTCGKPNIQAGTAEGYIEITVAPLSPATVEKK